MRYEFLARHSHLMLVMAIALGGASTPVLATHSAERTSESYIDVWVTTALRFVTWPSERAAPMASIVLCHPAGEMSRLHLQNKSVRGLNIVMTAVATPAETGPCHAFISESTNREANGLWLRAFHNRPVLLLGVSPEFCLDGGMVCPSSGTVGTARYAVNYGTTARTGLVVSSHLPAYELGGLVPLKTSVN